MKGKIGFLLAVSGLIFLAGCGGSGSSSSPPAANLSQLVGSYAGTYAQQPVTLAISNSGTITGNIAATQAGNTPCAGYQIQGTVGVNGTPSAPQLHTQLTVPGLQQNGCTIPFGSAPGTLTATVGNSGQVQTIQGQFEIFPPHGGAIIFPISVARTP